MVVLFGWNVCGCGCWLFVGLCWWLLLFVMDVGFFFSWICVCCCEKFMYV